MTPKASEVATRWIAELRCDPVAALMLARLYGDELWVLLDLPDAAATKELLDENKRLRRMLGL